MLNILEDPQIIKLEIKAVSIYMSIASYTLEAEASFLSDTTVWSAVHNWTQILFKWANE